MASTDGTSVVKATTRDGIVVARPSGSSTVVVKPTK